LHGSQFEPPSHFGVAKKKKNGVAKRGGIVGEQEIRPFSKLSPSAPMEVETNALPIAMAS